MKGDGRGSGGKSTTSPPGSENLAQSLHWAIKIRHSLADATQANKEDKFSTFNRKCRPQKGKTLYSWK